MQKVYNLGQDCLLDVMWLLVFCVHFLYFPLCVMVGLQCVIVAFRSRTHLLIAIVVVWAKL